MEACPLESTKRSRLGQIGSCGSKCITRFQSVYTSGASAMGVPGCPDLACCTASIESVRMVLIQSWSNSVWVRGDATTVFIFSLLTDPEISVPQILFLCGAFYLDRRGSNAL